MTKLSRKGRPPGSTNKKPAKKASGIIDKYVTSKLEKAITTVQIKKEKLEESPKDTTKIIVSPDKAKIRRPKTQRRSLSPNPEKVPKNRNSDAVMKKMVTDQVKDSVAEAIDEYYEVPQNLTGTNIFSYIQKTKLGQLLSLPTEQMKQVVKAWKVRQNDDHKIVQTMQTAALMLGIEEAKEEVEAEEKRELLLVNMKSQAQEDFEQLQFMNLTKSSTLAEVQLFDKKELCTFIKYMNKDECKNIPYEMLLDKPMNEIQEWTLAITKNIPDKEQIQDVDMVSVNQDSNDDESDNKTNKITESTDLNTSSNNDSVQEVNKSKESVLKIDEMLKDKEIMKANSETLKRTYHQFTIETGIPIQYDVINMWPKSVLQEIIKTKRDMTISQKPKKKISNLKQTSKYSSKKMTQTSLTQRGKVLNTCRYSLAFTIPDEYRGTEGLRKYLIDIFNEMINYSEDGFCILPWDSDEITDKITEADDIPDRITDLKKYFNGARSPESSIYIYVKLRLGFPLSCDKTNFDADIQGWCKNRSIRFYVCSVQHPNVRSCGWLAYMPRTVNQEKWCQAVKQLYQSTYKDKPEPEFQIGLTWRVLNGQKDVGKKDKLRAMHVDAPVEIGTRVKRFLRALSHKKKWLLGVKFRVIDEFHQYMKPTAKQKYRYMVSKHKAMMNQIAMCDCTQIINLDKKIGGSTMTVRDIVVNIRDNDDNYRIFASIDEKWNSDTLFTATYRPDKASKAYDFMRSLATYVQYLFPEASLKRIFTLDAIEKAKNENYHHKTQTFITQDDTELDREIQDDMDDDSMGFLELEDNLENPFQIDESISLVGGNSVWNFQGDDETVSTAAGSTGGVSFNSAHMRYYDTKSCASSVASSIASKEDSIEGSVKENSDEDPSKEAKPNENKVPLLIKNQLKQLNDMATHSIAEEDATDVVAGDA